MTDLGIQMDDRVKPRWEMATILKTLEPWRSTMSVIACVIAISFDPLFFYIPYIDDDNKCLGADKRMRNTALISRSLTDFIFTVHLVHHTRTAKKSVDSMWVGTSTIKMQLYITAVLNELHWPCLLIDFVAVLPIPQVLIVAVFFKMRGPNYLENTKAMSFFLLAQYLPRMYRIYVMSKKLRKKTAMWLQGAFNFFMYIISSHILGAFWYFFSILRVTECWHQSYCKTGQGCATTYYCDNTALIDIPLINGSCPISPPDKEKFDFGMFGDGLQSGNAGPIKFSVKLFYSLWWALRKLSLETSTYVWENVFAILISVVGLILFSYLIGNMQQCMQWEEEKKLGSDKFELMKTDLQNWMKKNELDDAMQKNIIQLIKKKLDDDADFNFSFLSLFSTLPQHTQQSLKRFLCEKIVKQVPELMQMNALDERFLDLMYKSMRPVYYTEDTFIFRMGELLDRMVFITDGTICTYVTATESSIASMDTNFLRKGDSYGHELLNTSSSASAAPTKLPPSPANVRCHTDVEAFVLMNSDLERLMSPAYDSRIIGATASPV